MQPPERSDVRFDRQGMAAALVDVAIQLGGRWVIVVEPSGQLRLVQSDLDELD